MEQTKMPKVPFTVAGTFLIAYCVLQVMKYVFYRNGMFGYQIITYDWQSLVMWLTWATLAVFVTMRRYPVVNTICIGVIFASQVYSSITMFANILEAPVVYGGMITLFSIFCDYTGVFSLLLLFLMSIGALTKKSFTGVGRIWVFAMLLKILQTIVSFSMNFISAASGGQTPAFMIMQLNNSIIFCVAICLLCKWYGRTLSARRDANTYKPARQYVNPTPVVNTMAYATPNYARPAQSAEVQNVDALKKYKELMDAGIITEEEFNAKKKQILGL